MVAAAVLAVDRRGRGLAPYWPSALSLLTGYNMQVRPPGGSCAFCGPTALWLLLGAVVRASPPPPPLHGMQNTAELAAAVAGAQRVRDALQAPAAASPSRQASGGSTGRDAAEPAAAAGEGQLPPVDPEPEGPTVGAQPT